ATSSNPGASSSRTMRSASPTWMSDDHSLPEWRCASCGEIHTDLPAFAMEAPAIWFDAGDDERARDFELTSDTCIWRNEAYFVRCVLELPFAGREGGLEFGVW